MYCNILEVHEETRQDQSMGPPEIELKCKELHRDINFGSLCCVSDANMYEYNFCAHWWLKTARNSKTCSYIRILGTF